MKIGILPLFNKGFIDNPAWCKPFLETVDRIGVESVWTVEHPIVAENYEKLYGKLSPQMQTYLGYLLKWFF